MSCAEIAEVKKNRAYCKQLGAFHIKTRRDNYNFAPSGSEFEAIIRPQSGFIVISPALSEGDPAPILDAVTKCVERASGDSRKK